MSDNKQNIPDSFKKIIKSKYTPVGISGNYNNGRLQTHFADISERLSDLEHKVNPTAKKILSNRSQQMLILHHLGVLDRLNEFNISGKKKAKLLSILLNASPDNIEGDLSIIHNSTSKIYTSDNYKIVNAAFKQAGIKKLIEETETILEKLITLENK